eukprot:TRINITY_DN34051_c0_g1_i1.p1 TRINITY_DN34051_c0_g1~~TRINITY_DN34051_c0_g1_i1.p1  ORF type:complete len:665 (+),score=89.85 TRINITY_DN34051_c0_g1_i1:52-1995(+)
MATFDRGSVYAEPHESAMEFAYEKKKHQTPIRNSPPRYHRQVNHPYEHNELSYSKNEFDHLKKLHKTEVCHSVERSQRRQPMHYDCDHIGMDGPPYHMSQSEFQIEKAEHMTPILPERPIRQPEVRSPTEFRHKSQAELSQEVSHHQTELYPIPDSKPAFRRVDNYLKFTPYEDGFLHTSCHQMSREKHGHLTEIHNSPRKVREPPTKGPSPADYNLHTSSHTLQSQKRIHQTELLSSNRRSRSCNVRDISPMYMSNGKFEFDKRHHRATISQSPRRDHGEGDDKGPTGYTSHQHFSHNKRRHSVAPPTIQPSLRKERVPHEHHCGHVSNDRFSSEKRVHVTDIHNSARRSRSAEPVKRSNSSNFTSRSELERAKRCHHISLGASAPQPVSPSRIHSSRERFASEKRAHRTTVGNVYTPPDPVMVPPNQQHSSVARFSSHKRLHKTDIHPSPNRSERSPLRHESVSPSRMTSQSMLQSEKSKHSIEFDKVPIPQAALTPQSLSSRRSSYDEGQMNRQAPPRSRSSEGPRSRSSDGGRRLSHDFDARSRSSDGRRIPSHDGYEVRSRSSDGGHRREYDARSRSSDGGPRREYDARSRSSDGRHYEQGHQYQSDACSRSTQPVTEASSQGRNSVRTGQRSRASDPGRYY